MLKLSMRTLGVRAILVTTVIWGVVGCSTRIDAMVQTVKAISPDDNVDLVANAKLVPSFRYLRVMRDDVAALLTLGYVDPHPQGEIEVWYSAKKEVLRIQNGRLVGLTGADIEWRHVEISGRSAWPSRSEPPVTYTRTIDVMPGYRFGIVDQVTVHAIDAPPKSNLVSLPPGKLAWFEEGDAMGRLPPARFALHMPLQPATPNSGGNTSLPVVIYGEQCLTREACFSWQQWPPVLPSPQ